MKEKVNNIVFIFRLGGISAVIKKIISVIKEGKETRTNIEYDICSKARVEDYPRLLKIIYKHHTGDELELENPVSFNEKIQWLKLNDRNPLKTDLADKYLVRDWISETIGEKYLIPLLGVWDEFDEIDLNSLPNQFVLKCNHGSGMSVIVKNKEKINWQEIKEKIDKWMATDFAFVSGFELHYSGIKRKIIAEEYIENMDGNLYDYKIHCFNGEPRIIQVIGDRDIVKHQGKEIFLDCEWNTTDLMYSTYDKYDEMPKKPESFEEMICVAQRLSKQFSYVRVDLYEIEHSVLFGEMTFTPASGLGKWDTKLQDKIVGEMIRL